MNTSAEDTMFPYAPEDWSEKIAETVAEKEGIHLKNDHWREIRALQEYYSRHEYSHINVRELSDALDESFHDKGGMRYLYTLFPQGPIAQGCRIAGLEMPRGAVDKGFGSVV